MTASTPRRPRVGPAQTALLLAGSCLPILAAVLIAPLLPRIQDHFAGQPGVAWLVPVLLTVPALMVALLAPFVGRRVDRIGRKRLLVAALVAYGVFGVLPIWLASLPLIVATRVLLGVAEAVIITCCTTLIGDYYDGPARERMLSLQAMASSASAAVFFVVGGALGDTGWRVPFALYAVGLPLALLAWRVIDEPRDGGAAAATPEAQAPFPWRRLMPVYGVTLVGAVLFYVPVLQIGFVLEALRVHAPQQVGQAIGVAQGAVLLSAFAFRWLSRAGTARLLALSFGLSALGLGLLATAATYNEVVVAAVVNGLGGGLLLPTLATWALSLLSFQHRGRGSGSFMGCFYVGQFVSPMLVLALMALSTGRSAAIGWLAGVALLSCATALVLSRRRHDALPQPADAAVL